MPCIHYSNTHKNIRVGTEIVLLYTIYHPTNEID